MSAKTLMVPDACAQCGAKLRYKPPALRGPYCSRTCAGLAKRTLPTIKTCLVCEKQWTPATRFQASRGKTCSPECNGALISRQKKLRGPKHPSELPGMMETTCPQCAKVTFKPRSWVKQNVAAYCSRSCRAKAQTHLRQHSGNGKGKKRPGTGLKGAANPAWKNGVTYRKRRGNYVSVRYVRCPPDLIFMARRDGYVMEHRLVMARWIGRPLSRTECVHHIDHKPLNNSRSNLELWPTNQSHKAAEHGNCVIGAANRLFLTDSEQPSNLPLNLYALLESQYQNAQLPLTF